jgi:hypothetical protein
MARGASQVRVRLGTVHKGGVKPKTIYKRVLRVLQVCRRAGIVRKGNKRTL